MPYDEVLSKFKAGDLTIGKSNKKVKSRKQATAIMLSEKKKAGKGFSEYKSKN
jgi:hypothetical protein